MTFLLGVEFIDKMGQLSCCEALLSQSDENVEQHFISSLPPSGV
jgi:hypothetical protein